MMFGLGDVPHPLAESAELVESVVLDQMISVLRQASEIAEVANRETIAPEDILFIMKRNPKALKRLIIYLGVKDEARIHANLLKPTPEETLPEGFAVENVSHEVDSEEPSVRFSHSGRIGLSEWNKGRKKYCLAFLKTIGIDESDLNQVVDIVKETRLNRANNQALSLSSTTYESFHAARCESFCSANMSAARFLKWICVRGGWKEEVSQPVLDILVYLAKETIACIIDMVMTLREELALLTKGGKLRCAHRREFSTADFAERFSTLISHSRSSAIPYGGPLPFHCIHPYAWVSPTNPESQPSAGVDDSLHLTHSLPLSVA
ncbi:unnamed protein product [Nesidiocoris tenuis]|uniref:Uncharacterized protein n=1 Tax=Nesidiocoris tenuis TaxID=355587 RepID=A0A6H5HC85_9HEMI|nr:unnamed protein product [Nesidiocoris tenuis]